MMTDLTAVQLLMRAILERVKHMLPAGMAANSRKPETSSPMHDRALCCALGKCDAD